ncbi:MAG: radical SAM protein, partial [Gammaproteobacteria bacterium]|nr:radical SAM protein [Gammaproteobacteria bacterium]
MNNIKVTFLNPPYLKNYSRPQRSPSVTKSGTLYFPMWLSYAAGYTGQGGHEIDLIDAPATGLQEHEVIELIRAFSPRLLAVDTSTPSIFNDARFCGLVRKEIPDVVIIMVGTHVSALPEWSLMLNAAIDAIAIGEYDITIKEIADALSIGDDYTRVAGICYRDDTDKPLKSEARKPIKDLDSLPMVSSVYRHFLDIRNYFNPNALFPMVTITTSRGCPHHCTFCVYPQTMTGHKVRLRSVDNLVAEIEFIARSFPEVKSIFFEDDTFAANKSRCQQICREIIRRNIHIAWTANARADLDQETMRIMRNAG